MPNRNQDVYVAVDPEAYGVGLGLGCLLRFWRPILAAIVIMVVIGAVSLWIENIKSTRQRNEWERVAEVAAETRATAQENVGSKTKILEDLRASHQSILLESEIGDPQACGDYMILHTMEFGNEGVRLNFDASLVNNGNNSVTGSWLMWNPALFGTLHGSEGGILPAEAQVFRIYPTTSCTLYEGYDLWVEHFSGYFIYPYESFFDTRNSEDGILYFSLGFGSKYKEDLFPLLNLNQAETWNIASDTFTEIAVGASTRENHERGNSTLILNRIVADHQANRVTLMLTIAVDPGSNSFTLGKPDQVSIVVNSDPIYPSRWNGVFESGEEFIDEIGWAFEPWSRDGSIQFDAAWSEIQQAGCFDFYYGNSYAILGVCLP